MSKQPYNFDKQVIIQSNYLVEAHYRLTLQEKRLILWLVKEININDQAFKKYKLNISEFAQMMNFNLKTQYKELKKLTKSLITRFIEINDVEKQELTQMSWLCFARWEEKKGICLLEFHPELKPYLLQLKNQFTKIELVNLFGLKSVYSVRIFELLVQYESIGKRKMTVQNMRSWCGIRGEEYQLYAHFKSRVIDKAKTEINAKTEYFIDYQEIKESRKVVAIEWTIKKKDLREDHDLQHRIEKLEKELNQKSNLVADLIAYGFSKSLANKFVLENDESIIKNAMLAVSIQISRDQVKNPKAMLKTAIKERWHPEIYKKRSKPLF